MIINKQTKLALIGMMLGDANIQKVSEQSTARLRVIHSIKQYRYILHKYAMFKEIINTCVLASKEVRDNGNIYHKRYFNTLVVPELHFYYQLFYRDGVKVIPKNIHRYLKEPIVLAYWYMDDGALKWKNHSNGVRLCTDNFSEKEVYFLAEKLNQIYSWNVTVQKQGKKYRLYIPNRNFEFSQLIFPFVLKSMQYKVPMPLIEANIFNETKTRCQLVTSSG
jgi:hypothetical protein